MSEKNRKTVYFDDETLELLRLYCFQEDVRTVNTAASQIVSEYLIAWRKAVDKR